MSLRNPHIQTKTPGATSYVVKKTKTKREQPLFCSYDPRLNEMEVEADSSAFNVQGWVSLVSSFLAT
jgi:hypothetical protein